MNSESDQELLAQYARTASEPAFTEIVNRHLDLVYSTALRLVVSPDLARDVAQRVFSDLARKAKSLGASSEYASLTGWLHRAARFAALELQRTEQRRRARERQVMENVHNPAEPAPDWAQLGPLLDEALDSLDDSDRTALLLRYFENKSLRDVGAALGASDDAAQKRISRAVEKMRELLAKRGVAAGAAAVTSLIMANAVHAAPAGLAASISGTAVAATAASASASALKLASLKLAAAGLATSIVIVGLAYRSQPHASIPPAPKAAVTQSIPINGYEVSGYISLTNNYRAPSSQPQNVIWSVFDLKVNGGDWRLLTADMDGSGALFYQEDIGTTNEGFQARYINVGSSGSFPTELDALRSRVGMDHARELAAAAKMEEKSLAELGGAIQHSPRTENVPASYSVNMYDGIYPRSLGAVSHLIWFAFCFSPSTMAPDDSRGSNQLPIAWESGAGSLFLNSEWTGFDNPPFLIKRATFYYVGSKIDPYGAKTSLAQRGNPADPIAVFETLTTTNFSGLVLPSAVVVNRYRHDTNRTEASTPLLIESVYLKVLSVSPLVDGDFAASPVPGQLRVQDFRLAGTNSNVAFYQYVADSGTPLTLPELRTAAEKVEQAETVRRATGKSVQVEGPRVTEMIRGDPNDWRIGQNPVLMTLKMAYLIKHQNDVPLASVPPDPRALEPFATNEQEKAVLQAVIARFTATNSAK